MTDFKKTLSKLTFTGDNEFRGTLTQNTLSQNRNWTLPNKRGELLVDLPETDFFIVDTINGNNETAIKGSYTNPYFSIGGTNGAESASTSGDIIKIISDVEECGLGKDGLTYIFDKGVKLFFPEATPTPSGLATGHLWSDSGKGAIKITIYGGIHESEGYWFGNFDRGVVYTENASDIRIYDADRISLENDDGDIIRCFSDNSNIEIYSNGEIYSEYRLLQLSGANNKIVFKSCGRITFKERGIQQIGNGKSTVLLHSDTEIFFEGHYISALRGALYCNDTGNIRSHWTVQAPRIYLYELSPQNASNDGGLIFTWSNADIWITINADVIQMENVDPDTYTQESNLLSINRTNSGADVHVDFNVKRIILGKSHGLEDSNFSVNRDNSYIQFNNTDIVFLTDVANVDNCINGSKVRYAFTGTCKIILNPSAIADGQKAIGGTIGDSAFIIGDVITNGDVFDSTFTNLLTGNDTTSGIGIPNLIINNTSLIDYTKYNGLI